MPTASLPALEHHLETRLLELEKLHQTRPGLPTAMARAEAGERVDELLDEIAELQRRIDTLLRRPVSALRSRVKQAIAAARDVAVELVMLGLARDCERFSGGPYKGLELAGAENLPLPPYCAP